MKDSDDDQQVVRCIDHIGDDVGETDDDPGHFEPRAGLMIALCKEINHRQVEALASALEETPAKLEEVADVISKAYMDCHTAVGPEWHAIAAALRGDTEMDAYQREMMQGHAAFYFDALAPLSGLSPQGGTNRAYRLETLDYMEHRLKEICSRSLTLCCWRNGGHKGPLIGPGPVSE